MTQPLNLSLSDEEIEGMHRKESGIYHPYDCCAPHDRRAIADAATQKAIWGIHHWLEHYFSDAATDLDFMLEKIGYKNPSNNI